METPDTEWERDFGEQLEMRGITGYVKQSIIEDVRRQRSSRDTYWKERLLQSIKDTNFLEKIEDEQDNRNSGIEVYRRVRDHIKAFTPITNEDNLK